SQNEGDAATPRQAEGAELRKRRPRTRRARRRRGTPRHNHKSGPRGRGPPLFFNQVVEELVDARPPNEGSREEADDHRWFSWGGAGITPAPPRSPAGRAAPIATTTSTPTTKPDAAPSEGALSIRGTLRSAMWGTGWARMSPGRSPSRLRRCTPSPSAAHTRRRPLAGTRPPARRRSPARSTGPPPTCAARTDWADGSLRRGSRR